MRWSDRMKKALETFQRVALPLYLWYFIFALAGFVLVIVGLIPFISPMIHPRGNFSGPFINPNPPMPPGRTFPGGSSPFSHNLAPYLDQAPYLFLVLVIALIVAWIATSAFITGIFNLTRKGFYEKVSFRDFRFLGIPRVLGWYGILTLVSVILMGAGIIGALALRRIAYALPLFAGLYVLALIALGIFFAPWLSTSAFYMLNHRELSFGRSLGGSWDFYRRNLGSLWLLLITLIGAQILISLINQAARPLGFLAALIIGPFTAILPIVWVLSLEEEETPLSNPSFDSTSDEVLQAQPAEPFSPDLEPSLPAEPIAPAEHQEPSVSDAPESPSADTPNYCPTCGEKTRPGANYCAQCGTKL